MSRLALLIPLVALLGLTGCDDEYQTAVSLVKSSKILHDELAGPVKEGIPALVRKHQEGGLTDAERARLKAMNDFRPYLNKYAALHNTAVSGLRVWEKTKAKPADLPEVLAEIGRFVLEATATKEKILLE